MQAEPDPFIPLATIRDAGKYSSMNASKAAMLPELYRLLSELREGYSRDRARQLVVIDNVLNKRTFDNRRTIWGRMSYRYFMPGGEWIAGSLIQMAVNGMSSPEFLSLAYLYYALRDRATFDFITTVICDRWKAGITSISAKDFLEFLHESQVVSPELKNWRETTRSRLARNTMAALRDFGLLQGSAIKKIQRPTITPDAVYHLLAILWAEGKRGRDVLDAKDWRLFLWQEEDINRAFIRLAQLGWIRFERGGQMVVLELVRRPEVVNGG